MNQEATRYEPYITVENSPENLEEQVDEESYQTILSFINEVAAERIGESQQQHQIHSLKLVINKFSLPGFKLEYASEAELENVVARINRSNYTDSTKVKMRASLKKFYKLPREKQVYMSSEWPKEFDLIMEEELLEAWGASDGVRELIANALDEVALSATEEPDIFEDNEDRWHIRDYGRGLTHQNLTQGEDEEKLNNPDKVTGKFGVGLKDALAVLYRKGVDVTAHSPDISFTVEQASKAGFDDIETLHAVIRKTEHPDLDGTEVILDGCTEEDIEEAKQNFLTYTDATSLEETRFGDVYEPSDDDPASIYVTGLRVATEEDFLFSYNITSTTKTIRDALNRERSNGGGMHTHRV